MNLSAKSKDSIYQFTENLENAPKALYLNYCSVDNLVTTLIDFSIGQQLNSVVWMKISQKNTWLEEVKRFLQKDNLEKVYLYQKELSLELESTEFKDKVISFDLELDPVLEGECFFILLSSQCCSMIIGQTLEDENYLKTICSFDSKIIKSVLEKIRENIIIDDNIKSNLFINSKDINLKTESITVNLLNYLFLQQLEKNNQLEENSKQQEDFTLQISQLNEEINKNREFLGKLGRELRQPISTMKTALSLLESTKIKKEQRLRYLQLLKKECEYQNSLIRGLLELIEIDKLPIEERNTPVYLDDLVPGIVSTYQPLAIEKGIQLGYTIPSGFPPVSCPISWLRQVIIQMLNNSLKFTPSQGKVFVRASCGDKFITLIFTDTGIGIPRNEINQIFNSFYRGQNAKINDNISAGLGLTIVKKIIDFSGGSISVTSIVEKGSKFKVLLPIFQEN